MSKKTAYLLGILLTIIVGTVLNYYLCCNCTKCSPNAKQNETEASSNIDATPEAVKEATKNAFSMTDSKSKMTFSANENFNFKGSDYSLLEPVSNDINLELSKLSRYINDNPGKTVNVTGYYTAEENNNSAFPNLGLARANAIKNHFVSKGISSKVMNTYGELNDELVPDADGVFHGPSMFSIGTTDVNDTSQADELEKLKKELKLDPLVLYFKTGAASINLSAAQRLKVAKITRYVDKADDASVQVVGHSDNTGDRNKNIELGKNRADFAKSYLVRNGISKSNIMTSSKGPDMPIADNATEEGKAKNRRVEVTIN